MSDLDEAVRVIRQRNKKRGDDTPYVQRVEQLYSQGALARKKSIEELVGEIELFPAWITPLENTDFVNPQKYDVFVQEYEEEAKKLNRGFTQSMFTFHTGALGIGVTAWYGTEYPSPLVLYANIASTIVAITGLCLILGTNRGGTLNTKWQTNKFAIAHDTLLENARIIDKWMDAYDVRNNSTFLGVYGGISSLNPAQQKRSDYVNKNIADQISNGVSPENVVLSPAEQKICDEMWLDALRFTNKLNGHE